MTRCPFIEPEYDLDIDEPCPVCGMDGHNWGENDRCIGDAVDTGDRLHQILGEALAAAVSGSGERGNG